MLYRSDNIHQGRDINQFISQLYYSIRCTVNFVHYVVTVEIKLIIKINRYLQNAEMYRLIFANSWKKRLFKRFFISFEKHTIAGGPIQSQT